MSTGASGYAIEKNAVTCDTFISMNGLSFFELSQQKIPFGISGRIERQRRIYRVATQWIYWATPQKQYFLQMIPTIGANLGAV